MLKSLDNPLDQTEKIDMQENVDPITDDIKPITEEINGNSAFINVI